MSSNSIRVVVIDGNALVRVGTVVISMVVAVLVGVEIRAVIILQGYRQ